MFEISEISKWLGSKGDGLAHEQKESLHTNSKYLRYTVKPKNVKQTTNKLAMSIVFNVIISLDKESSKLEIDVFCLIELDEEIFNDIAKINKK